MVHLVHSDEAGGEFELLSRSSQFSFLYVMFVLPAVMVIIRHTMLLRSEMTIN